MNWLGRAEVFASREPLATSTRSDPNDAIWPTIKRWAASPMDSTTITDITPITIPSMARAERFLVRRRFPTDMARRSRARILLDELADFAAFLDPLIRLQQPVTEAEHAFRVLGRVRFVRHKDHGMAVLLVQRLQEVHRLLAGL